MWFKTITILALIISTTSKKLVDLSGRGMKKEDFFVRMQSQFSLQEVTDLILRNNEFDSFLDCSTNLENLRTLDLSQNHLKRFFFLCKDEYNLQMLNISHNKLEYIDDNAFNDRIPKLKILDLSCNKLSIVNETMLEHFKILEYLTLANNPINDGIHENALWNLKALRYLNLSNVSSSHFSSELFKTLSNLSTLDLSHNPVNMIPLLPISLEELDLSDTHITRFRYVYLPRLRELKLNNMQALQELVLNDFENFISLEILSLDGSKKVKFLKMFPYDDRLLPRLQRLSISNCGLKTLEYNLMSIIKRTPILTLENNPWNCDCKMQWLNIVNATRAISREIRCSSPIQHANKQLSEIPSQELECDDEATSFHPVLWACIFILVVSTVLAVGFFVVRRPIGHWDIRRKNRDTVTYTNVDESSNDLVRILAVGETVERNEE
ncbi:PREDICTED: leucine-rich repeat neuronal protein 1-like [Eufriesea mexicana]|uniref:leucine-rich repeat neuronal protein 1-like n=1 Tax=Eufriesea mexicana TaxID=516756 RepID=UPI00083C59C6|nr:PREDICTED: leucine-rich repeat neuronal protein 1-like [Eufriesea mexicana]